MVDAQWPLNAVLFATPVLISIKNYSQSNGDPAAI
jgi:hypothetical protein